MGVDKRVCEFALRETALLRRKKLLLKFSRCVLVHSYP